jgi:isopenicillin N synthase-like dioxygenase
MQKFFALPTEEKMEASWNKSPACRGYEPFDESSKAANTVASKRAFSEEVYNPYLILVSQHSVNRSALATTTLTLK